MNKIAKCFIETAVFKEGLIENVNVFDIITNFYIEKNITPKYPMFLNLFITSQCNGKCFFCSASSKSIEKEEDKANPFLKVKLEELKNEQSPLFISLCGGEPMLYPRRCKEYLNVFKDTDTIFYILSNLSLDLNNERISLLHLLKDNPFSLVQTSIDSLNENEHRKLRNGTDLMKILSNIKALQKIGIRVKVNATVSEYNYKNIMDVVRYAYNEGIEDLHINHVLPFGRAEKLVSKNLLMDIIYSLMEVASSKEFNNIKNHTITFPPEMIPLSYIGSRYKDILDIYKGSNDKKYLSGKFIYNISHENNYSSTGWISSEEICLDNKSIIQAYNLSSTKCINYHNDFCGRCSQLYNCNYDSFYTGDCLMIDLYNKIEFILEHKIKPTDEEAMKTGILYELETRSPTIYDVIIALTNECNGNCNFCQVDGHHKDKHFSINVENIISFLKGNNYIIQITGGEPLLKKYETEVLIKKLKEERHLISLLTNAVLIDEPFIDVLSDSFTSLDVVQVSVYAHNSELHKIISGRDDWMQLNDVIKKLINAGIQVRANLTLTNENLKFIDKIYQFYKKLGLKQIAINGLIKKGRALNMVNERYIFNYIYYVYNFLKDNSIQGLSLSIPPEVIKTFSNIKSNFGYQIINENLLLVENNKCICIDSDGLIYSGTTGELIGSISDKKLDNINLSPIKRELYNSECKTCHGYYFCKGKCDYEQVLSKYGNLNYSYCDVQ